MDGGLYAIQKVFKNYPGEDKPRALFDFAMCEKCMGEARRELSTESRLRIDRFMMEGLKKLEESGQNPGDRFEQRLCTLSGQALSDCREYQVMAVCQADQILESPLCLSEAMLEEIQSLLSEKSREELNRFSENNFGWPPELKKAIIDGDLVLL